MSFDLTYDRGVHLRGTPLWFDADAPRQWCIATSWPGRRMPVHQRLFVTPQMALALQRMGYRGSLLPTPLDRAVGVGGMRLRLLSAGAGGEAMAMLDDATLLLAGRARRDAQVPQVEHLVVHAPAVTHHGQPLAQIVEQLADRFRREGALTACVDNLSVGAALCDGLEGIVPVRALGNLQALRPDASVSQPTSVRVGLWGSSRARPLVWVDTGLAARSPNRFDERIALHYYVNGTDLRRLVDSAKCARLSLVRESAVELPKFGDNVAIQWLSNARQETLLQG